MASVLKAGRRWKTILEHESELSRAVGVVLRADVLLYLCEQQLWMRLVVIEEP